MQLQVAKNIDDLTGAHTEQPEDHEARSEPFMIGKEMSALFRLQKGQQHH